MQYLFYSSDHVEAIEGYKLEAIEGYKYSSSGNTWSGEFMKYRNDVEEMKRDKKKFEDYSREVEKLNYDFKDLLTRQAFGEKTQIPAKPQLKIKDGWNDKKYKEWIEREFFENYFFNGIESVNTGKLHLVLIKCRNNESPAYGYAVSIEFELNKEYSVEEAKIKAFEAIAEAISLRTKSASEIEAIAEA